MKSIYDEALKMLDKNRIIKQAIEQAQKQEKLLKLYQKLYHDYYNLTMNEEIDVHKQIWELKNEK